MGRYGGPTGAGAEARAKAKKYELVVNYLESKYSELENSISMVENALAAQDTTFQSNEAAAQGLIKTTFDTKASVVWKPQYELIIKNMYQGLKSITFRRDSARQMQIYWEQYAEIEEAKANAGLYVYNRHHK